MDGSKSLFLSCINIYVVFLSGSGPQTAAGSPWRHVTSILMRGVSWEAAARDLMTVCRSIRAAAPPRPELQEPSGLDVTAQRLRTYRIKGSCRFKPDVEPTEMQMIILKINIFILSGDVKHINTLPWTLNTERKKHANKSRKYPKVHLNSAELSVSFFC